MPQFLVIQLARFGDLVQTKRLIGTLEQRGQVHLCIDPGLSGVAALLYPTAHVHPLPVHHKPDASALRTVRATCAALAATPFDAVYNLNHAGMSRVLARLFVPEQVRGHSMHGPQVLRSAWVRRAFRWTMQRALAPVNLVDFWAFLDEAPYDPATVNPVATGRGGGIGVVLAGRESRRSLPAPLLTRCVQTAFEALGGPPVFLLGSAAESPLARQLLRALPGRMVSQVTDLSGKTSWKELADVVSGLDVVLSPDTGTMHLAAHLGVPVQAFFLSSAWCHETGPYGVGHTVWQSAYECAPCLESAPCVVNTACLRDFGDAALLRGLARTLRGESLASGQGGQGVQRVQGDQREQDAHGTQGTQAPQGARHWPASLLCCQSRVDSLGGLWHVLEGHDPHALRRKALRALVAETLHVPCAEPLPSEVRQLMQDQELLDIMYEEADWMLPPHSQWRYAHE